MFYILYLILLIFKLFDLILFLFNKIIINFLNHFQIIFLN